MRSLIAGLAVGTVLVGAIDCAEPTAVVVEVVSEVPCTANAEVLLYATAAAPRGAPASSATRCTPIGNGLYHRGTVVLAPSANTSSEIGFSLLTRDDGADVDAACRGTDVTHCIEARRQLRFLPHHTVDVRVDLRLSCLGVVCPASKTCVSGSCVDATLDLAACGNGCQLGTSDAGALDSGPPDSGTDGGATPLGDDLAAGNDFTCATTPSRGVKCWGGNTRGELGIGGGASVATPSDVFGLTSVAEIAAGSFNACVVVDGGGVRCWGENVDGDVGDGTVGGPARVTPVTVVGVDHARHVSVGGGHACAVRDDGTVRCWGRNDFGQLGSGAAGVPQATAVNVVGVTGALDIGCGASTSCARGVGWVRCWGKGSEGELGDGAKMNSAAPVTVNPSSGFVGIQVGRASACTRVGTGEIRCWGANGHGQLGDGSLAGKSTPSTAVSMGGGIALTFDVGDDHACAYTAPSSVRCWGLGASGQLGSGVSDTPTPIVVSLAGGVGSLAAGAAHTCARSLDTITCWGANDSGQLGDGTISPPKGPGKVVAFP